MKPAGQDLFLTWPGGPVLRLARTTLSCTLLRHDERRLLKTVPPWARHPWLVRNVWLRWLHGPHFLDEVSLSLDGPFLVLRMPNGRTLSWRMRPDDAQRAGQFVAELDRRRRQRAVHRVEGGPGRSLMPLVLFLLVLLWVFRRRRSST